MGFPRAWLAKGQHVLVPIDKAPLQQGMQLVHHLRRQTLAVEGLQVLLQRQPGFVQQTLDPFVPSFLALARRQLQQVALVTQGFLLGLLRQRLEGTAKGRQVQFLQVTQQLRLHIHDYCHPRTPLYRRDRRTPTRTPSRPSRRARQVASDCQAALPRALP